MVFFWSFFGFLLSVFNENDSGLVQLLYLASLIFSTMALNNRRYGVNHTIRLYHGYLVLPKMLNIWMISEEKIDYTDILEIDFNDFGNGTTKNMCEITLKTEYLTYPIFGKKLELGEFKELYTHLQEKTGVRLNDFPVFLETENDKELRNKSNSNTILAMIALIVSAITLIGISGSEPYSGFFSGEKIFSVSLIASLIGSAYLYYLIKKDQQKLNWKKGFLLLYICFYGCISITFSLIFINGHYDNSANDGNEFVISKEIDRTSRKGKCFVLKSLDQGRKPASLNNVSVCHPSLNGARCR